MQEFILSFSNALLGWGIDDMTGYLNHPARAIMTGAFLIASIGLLFIMPPNFGNKGQEGKVRRENLGAVVLIAGMISLNLVAPDCDRHHLLLLPASDGLRYFGLGVFLIGLFFSIWAPLHMGKQFSAYVTIQADHQLITDGPFQLVRHPRYAGLIVGFLGTAFVYRSLIGLIAVIVLTGLFLYRISNEEALLAQEFVQQWENYRQQTKRLIPFVY
jgi:protein-S-isoprenylcysteine O-methyltransferase Ste14